MHFLKIIVLFCLAHVAQMFYAQRACDEGELLCKLMNRPHRGLGMLWWAHAQYPDRVDFAKKYILQYLIAKDGEIIMEGEKMPIIEMEAALLARRFPHDEDFDIIRRAVMARHFKALAEKQKPHG